MVALIGYGVATSSSSNAIQKVAIATSTATRSLSQPTIRALDYIKPPFYVIDRTLDGYTLQSAESIAPDRTSTNLGPTGPAELWATAGATATSGSWFIVSEGTHHATGHNSYRTVVDDMEVVVEHDPASRQSRLSFVKDNHHVEITAFGWADRPLQRLATSVSVHDNEIRYADDFFATDHTLVLDSDPTQSLYGFPAARVGYASDDQSGRRFSITTASVDSSCALCARFALINTSSLTVRYTTNAVIGHEAEDPTMAVVQWRDKDYLITVRGDLDDESMTSIAQIVAPAPDGTIDLQLPTKLNGNAMPSNQRIIGSGMLGDGYLSTIAVGMNETLEYVWGVGQPSGSVKPRATTSGPVASIETLVEHGRTYVFAKAPPAAVNPHLRIYRNGLATVSIELSREFADVFAAYVFLEPVPFNADIVDADGQVIASWPAIAG